MRRLLMWGFVGLLGLFIIMQFIPIGGAQSNPPVLAEPKWDSPATRALAKRACFDCHSNETVWPIYSQIAPVAWLVRRDVNEGRSKLNFSEWTGLRRQKGLDDVIESIQRKQMPMAIYLPLHPEAKLTDAERQQLIKGLRATFVGN